MPDINAPRVKTLGSLGGRQGSKERWDANLPYLRLADFRNQAVEVRFVGAAFCQKLHTIYLNLDHAKELNRWRNRDRSGAGRNEQPNIPRDAKAFDVICTDFDYFDEKSYPNPTTGEYTCDCCGPYANYTKDRIQYFAWCLYRDPNTQQWVPSLKVLRFPSTVQKGITEAAGLSRDPSNNLIEDIASLGEGATVFIKYSPDQAPATQYSVQRGNYFPLPEDMRLFVESNMRPLEGLYRAHPQDPADTSRSLSYWKYPELLRASVPGAAPAGSFGGAVGSVSSNNPTPSVSQMEAPPSFRQQSAASTLTTFSSDDTVPAFGSAAQGIPTFGGEAPISTGTVVSQAPQFSESVPSFGGAVPSFGGAPIAPPAPAFLDGAAPDFGSASRPAFMGSDDFGGAPMPPPSRRTPPATSGF